MAGSWLVMQLVFALHYAHESYAADPKTGRGCGRAGLPRRANRPDYWDFLHFLRSSSGWRPRPRTSPSPAKRLRRLGTAHNLIAFAFNTLILALTINLVAGLF